MSKKFQVLALKLSISFTVALTAAMLYKSGDISLALASIIGIGFTVLVNVVFAPKQVSA